jgi:hypothetical protein
MTQKLIATLVSAVALAVLLAPAAPAAEQPNETQYGNPALTLPTETPPPSNPTTVPVKGSEPPSNPTTVAVQGASEPATPASTGDTLPFTGLDLGIVIAFGVAAVGGGLLLRRATRTTEQ